jgi:hypothetical protein
MKLGIKYEGYSESNLRLSVKKTSNEKIKLLINVVIAGIETLVSGNTFLYASVREVCRLFAQSRSDTFHHLLTVEAL